MDIKNGVSIDGTLGVGGFTTTAGLSSSAVVQVEAGASVYLPDVTGTDNGFLIRDKTGPSRLDVSRSTEVWGDVPTETTLLTVTPDGHTAIYADGSSGYGLQIGPSSSVNAKSVVYGSKFGITYELRFGSTPYFIVSTTDYAISTKLPFVSDEDSTFKKRIVYTGVVSPANLTASQNNWNPSGGVGVPTVVRFTCNASLSITGLIAGVAGQRVTLCNVGTNNITLSHESGSSTAANRFKCPNSAAFTLRKDGAVDLWYDSTSSRWRIVAP